MRRPFLALSLLLATQVTPVLASQDDTTRPALWSLRELREPAAMSGQLGIDDLLRRAHAAAGVEAAPRADRRVLIRRLWNDVCGLPAPDAERARFIGDEADGAWARAVDRALATRAYAENQARLWLDLARYADTAGDASDFPVPDAWRYRDWVIDAFASDMPWRDFVRAQLAGDHLVAETSTEKERAALIIATGFVALSRRFGVKPRQYSHLIREDSIDTVGRTFLGLTLSCARCHDHKFDPVTQRDYAALDGIFASTRYPHPGSETKRAPSELVELHPERIGNSARLAMTTAYAVIDSRPTNAHVQIGGVASKRGPRVPRGVLSSVPGPAPVEIDRKASGRLELANWLTDLANPLVPRVLVNRLWQQCFGRGIVSTPDDFGTRGARPSQPELLDWLARRFLETGSVRTTLRRILLSEAYRRSSDDAELARLDPDNTLFARQVRRRLTAEAYRDALLSVAGELDEGSPGPHPFPPVKAWRRYSQHKPFFATYPSRHRTVYVMRQRLRRTGVLSIFDGADPCAVTGRRGESIVPGQALWLRNSSFVNERVTAFARRTTHEDPRIAIHRATRIALGRDATAIEVAEGVDALTTFVERDASAAEAWESWCHMLLCSNEFVYVD